MKKMKRWQTVAASLVVLIAVLSGTLVLADTDGPEDDLIVSGITDPAPDDATGVYIDVHSYSELVLWPWGSEATQELMPMWDSAAPAAPTQRVTFTKEASDATPHVGETFAFTLSFNTVPTQTQELQVRVIDPNPAPNYLEIISDSITGGAAYSSTIDAVVWEDTLFPAGAQPQVIAFQVQATGIPPSAVAAGYPVTNTAMLVDLAMPGSLPEATAEAAIRILPLRTFLPIVVKNHGG